MSRLVIEETNIQAESRYAVAIFRFLREPSYREPSYQFWFLISWKLRQLKLPGWRYLSASLKTRLPRRRSWMEPLKSQRSFFLNVIRSNRARVHIFLFLEISASALPQLQLQCGKHRRAIQVKYVIVNCKMRVFHLCQLLWGAIMGKENEESNDKSLSFHWNSCGR